jgi:hypothetical protein
MKRVATCLIAVFGVACYRYAPAVSAVPSSGNVVRLQLSPTGAQTMSRILGRDAIAVEGRILSADDTSYAMAVTATRRGDDQPQTWAGEHVLVPRAAVQSVQARSLDRKKTFMIAVGDRSFDHAGGGLSRERLRRRETHEGGQQQGSERPNRL